MPEGPSWSPVFFEVLRVAEREAARGHLPRGAERLGELGIGLCDLFGERRELLIDAGEPRFVLLRVALLFHIATEEADLFHELRQQDREFVFHQRRDRFEPGSSSGMKWRINADTSIPFICGLPA